MVPGYVINVGTLDLFPSIASFFLLHTEHNMGPDDAEKIVSDISSFGASSAWQTAHLKIPEFEFKGKSFPNLQ